MFFSWVFHVLFIVIVTFFLIELLLSKIKNERNTHVFIEFITFNIMTKEDKLIFLEKFKSITEEYFKNKKIKIKLNFNDNNLESNDIWPFLLYISKKNELCVIPVFSYENELLSLDKVSTKLQLNSLYEFHLRNHIWYISASHKKSSPLFSVPPLRG